MAGEIFISYWYADAGWARLPHSQNLADYNCQSQANAAKPAK